MGSRKETLVIEFGYDGSYFHGIPTQPGFRTVGGELVSRIETAFRQRPRALSFASRTDAGVSACSNFLSFRVPGADLDGSARELFDAPWPPELQPLALLYSPVSLCARNCVLTKRYHYALEDLDESAVEQQPRTLERSEPPATAKHINATPWRLEQRLDVQKMRAAASSLCGKHDFTSFRAQSCSAKTTTRELMQLDVNRHRTGIEVVLEADGFLRKMARVIVGTLVEVGLGERQPEELSEILARRERRVAGITAPARGLTLLTQQLSLPSNSVVLWSRDGTRAPFRASASPSSHPATER